MATEIKILYLDKATGQPAHPAWLRGLEEASAYLGLKDKRHRKLMEWMADGLNYLPVGKEYWFRCEWIDEYLIKRFGHASDNLHPVTQELIEG